jgi:uncharacterized protein YraI
MRWLLIVVAVIGVAMLSPSNVAGEEVTARIGLNLRAGPGLGYAIRDVMPLGSYVEVVSGPDANGWYQVRYAGRLGYAFGEWIGPDTGNPVSSAAYAPPMPAATLPQAGGGYQTTVYAAAAAYGVSGDYLWWVHGCETGYTYRHDLWGPNGEYGPFQYMNATYYWLADLSGIGGSINDPVSQAYVTAWAFANGYSSHWVCR